MAVFSFIYTVLLSVSRFCPRSIFSYFFHSLPHGTYIKILFFIIKQVISSIALIFIFLSFGQTLFFIKGVVFHIGMYAFPFQIIIVFFTAVTSIGSYYFRKFSV